VAKKSLRIEKLVGKAIYDYNLITHNDKILIGISGGRDSFSLLKLLSMRQKKVPIRYELFPVHIDLGFDDNSSEKIKEYLAKQGFDVIIKKTTIGPMAHSSYNRENPCFLCSMLRRKALFEIANELGCKKIALGHHMDDIVETFFINMIYTGEISTMVPHQSLFKGKLSIIRPLAYVEKSTIDQFANYHHIPSFEDGCRYRNNSRRNVIKDLIKEMEKKHKKAKRNIFNSMKRVKTEYLLMEHKR